MIDDVDVKIPQHEKGNPAENSLGGTELLTMELFRRLPQEYKDKFQFVVSRVQNIEEEKKRLYWIHDLALDPAHTILTTPSIDLFSKLIFVSHWQQQQFNTLLKIPYDRGVVIKNAIDPIPKHEETETKDLQLIYASTPQRGLDILVNALNLIDRTDFHLHVFSSYKLYGWEQNDEAYKPLFEMCESDPRVTNHSTVSYEDLRKHWTNMHILAYPCTWQETSCRVAMEAMSAHCAVVTSNWGALPETCGEYAYMYNYTEDKNKHVERFADALEDVMDSYWTKDVQNNLDNALEYTYNHYSWDKRINQWIDFLDNLIYELDHEEDKDKEIIINKKA
jgi:glycosyltransferase involved in cell wall biosynthesis